MQEPRRLNDREFRTQLAEREIGVRDFARLTGTNVRTVRRWTTGEADIPVWPSVVLILAQMLNRGVLRDLVAAAARKDRTEEPADG